MSLTDHTIATGSAGDLPEVRTYRLHRSEMRDLEFQGRQLSRVQRDVSFPDRSTTVSIYVSDSGKYVTHIERGALVMQGSPPIEGMPASAKAGVHDTPAAAYEWLVAENKGKLGTLSKSAWNTACAIWPDLRGNDVERI